MRTVVLLVAFFISFTTLAEAEDIAVAQSVIRFQDEAISRDDAAAAYRRSESLLAVRAETDPAARATLAASRSSLGALLQHAGKTADALALLRRARADFEVLANAPGASNDARHDLAAAEAAHRQDRLTIRFQSQSVIDSMHHKRDRRPSRW